MIRVQILILLSYPISLEHWGALALFTFQSEIWENNFFLKGGTTEKRSMQIVHPMIYYWECSLDFFRFFRFCICLARTWHLSTESMILGAQPTLQTDNQWDSPLFQGCLISLACASAFTVPRTHTEKSSTAPQTKSLLNIWERETDRQEEKEKKTSMIKPLFIDLWHMQQIRSQIDFLIEFALNFFFLYHFQIITSTVYSCHMCIPISQFIRHILFDNFMNVS